MAYHGSVTEFQPGNEDWGSYAERMNYYFTANDITTNEKKRAILLNTCGSSTLKLIKGLIDTDTLNTTPYSDIVKLVQQYYAPPPFPIVQRYKFNTRVREPAESIAQYVAALRQLSEYCQYGDTLAEMFRDRLVCGINHEGIQRKILLTKDLTFDKAYQLALAVEAAERDTKDLLTSSGSTARACSLQSVTVETG